MKKFTVILMVLIMSLVMSGSTWSFEQPRLAPCIDGIAWRVTKHASSVFDGATATGKHGDWAAANTYTVFKVTGVVAIQGVVGVVGTSLTGTGEVQVGTATNLPLYIADTEAVNFDIGEVLGVTADPVDNTDAVVALFGVVVVSNGEDVVETSSTADITDGQIDYYIIWTPLSPGATVESTGTLTQV